MTSPAPLRLLAALLCAAGLAAAPAAAQVPPVTPPAGPSGPPVIAAAGDIACDPESEFFNNGLGDPEHCRQMATSDLLVGADLAAVLPLGDTQYEDSLLEKYRRSYDPSWGRVLDVSRPVIGNHEYFARDDEGASDGAQGYFDYFNGIGRFSGRAGDRDKGYYSFDVGDWHLIALNSVCSQIGGCGPGSPQEQWLREDLARHQNACTLAYFHHPMFTSSGVGWSSMETIWQVLHEAGADVVLSGHMHQYERLAPMNAAGVPDPAHGMRSFVVGSGGKNLGTVTAAHPNLEAVDTTSFGVLMLTLRSGGYDWRFVPAAGDTFTDTGSAACHAAPGPRPPVATTGPVGGVSADAATMHGAVEPSDQPSTYHFEYGPTESYGLRTAEATLPTYPDRRIAVTARVAGLEPGSKYHYRVVVTNSAGTYAGADRTFEAAERSRYADIVGATPGLLAYWRFGEVRGDVAFDERGAFTGTNAGTFLQRRRGAIVGDGNRATQFGPPFGSMRAFGPSVSRTATIEGWFRWADGPVLLRDDSSQGGWYIARDSGGRLTFRVAGVTYRTTRASGTVRDNAWHHLALTKDGPTVNLYVDGRRAFSGGGAPDTPPTMPWHIMRNGPFEQHAPGVADELAIYERALTRSEVVRRYRIGVADTVPKTRLTLVPRRATNDIQPVLAFQSNEKRAQMRCALSRPGQAIARPSACRTSMRLPALIDGTYKFSVYAIDRKGYPDPTPATTTFTVDTVAPGLTVQIQERTIRQVALRGVPVTVSCTESCSARARLILDGRSSRRLKLSKGRPMEIGRAIGRVRSTAPRTLRVRVSGGDVRRRLRKLRSATITVRVSATDAAGNARGFRGTVPLVR